MSYLALYRKWRPQTFAALVGQDHVAQTLINAITHKRLAHAYLFCGPRGTGKTTSARLLARALNCKQGPTPQPCGECANCKDIAAGSSLDVIEIDAASNRGVGEMRELLGRVHHAAVSGGHRIYIIDEVHMLTAEAFNTLLKTLEEPPPNLIFILATTEAQKVLPTIISRCQRLDFRRIATGAMLLHLRKIADEEGIRITPISLQAIARRAEGGLRDAISLLDQVSSLGQDGAEVSAELVLHLLGMVATDQLAAIADAVADRQVPQALERVRALLDGGYDYVSVLRELLEHFRNLLLTQLAPEAALAELAAEDRPLLEAQSRRFSPDELFLCMDVLRETEGVLKGTTQPQIWLETGIMRLCQRQGTELTGRVAELERLVKSQGTVAAPPPPAPVPRRAAPVTPPPEPGAVAPEPPRAPPSPAPPPPAPEPTDTIVAERSVATAPEPAPPTRPRSVIPFLSPSQGARNQTPAAKPALPEPEPEPAPLAEEPAPVQSAAPARPAPPPESAPVAASGHQDRWAEVLQELKEHQPLIYGQVGDGRLLAADDTAKRLTIALPQQFLKEQLDKNPRRRKTLSDLVERVFGAAYALHFEVHAPDPAAGREDAPPASSDGPPDNGHADGAVPPPSFPTPVPRPASFAQEVADVTRGRVIDFPWPGD